MSIELIREKIPVIGFMTETPNHSKQCPTFT